MGPALGEPVDVLSQDSLERAVAAAAIAVPPRYLEETASTNTVAAALADEGAPEWTVVAAGHQTAGRGRLGRSWTSAPGRSLLFSVVLRPPLAPEAASLVSLLAAAEMARACPPLGEGRVRTKWPNDLMAGHRKLGGVLPEARVEDGALRHIVLGVGVNVSMAEADFPPGLGAAATSLSIEGADVRSEELLAGFLCGFRGAYDPRAPGFAARAVDRYRSTCATLGRRVRARTTGGAVVEGAASDLDGNGGLIVERDGERHVVGFGEVVHID